MNNIYSKVFITNLPSFYKLNLYNAIAENERIFVVFTGDTAGERNRDFSKVICGLNISLISKADCFIAL